MLNNQKGAIPLIVLVSLIGILVFIALTSFVDFKSTLFGGLFPKPSSLAQNNNFKIEIVNSNGQVIENTTTREVKARVIYTPSTQSFSVGQNITAITHYGYENPSTKMDTDVNLQEMQRMGVKIVRVFAARKEITDQEAARRLGVFLDKANNYGISVMVSLIDYYHSGFNPKNTDQFYSNRFQDLRTLNEVFFINGYRDKYKNFVKTVVEQNRHKSNIYAWEIGNELKSDTNPQAFKSFMREMSTYIKDLDNKHKVATGMIVSMHTGLTPEQLYTDLKDVDIITIHSYDGDRNGERDAKWAREHGKEISVNEIGFSGSERRAEKLENEIKFWKSQGASSVLQWGFIAKGLDNNDNGDRTYGMDTIWHSDYEALFSLYKRYNQEGLTNLPSHFRISNSTESLLNRQGIRFSSNPQIINWNLTKGLGLKRVYAQFKINNSWSQPISTTVKVVGTTNSTPKATPQPTKTSTPTSKPTSAPTPSPAVNVNQPRGYVVYPNSPSTSCSTITGWSCDWDKNTQSVQVDIWDHTSGAVFLGSVMANQDLYQGVDLQNACKHPGVRVNHGYKFTIPSSIKDGNTHKLRFYGINIDSNGKRSSAGHNVLKAIPDNSSQEVLVNCR